MEVYIAWSNVHIGHGVEGSALTIFEGWRGSESDFGMVGIDNRVGCKG